MRGLAYLEWRYAFHQTLGVLHSPVRLAMWIVYALLLVFIFFARTGSPQNQPAQFGIGRIPGDVITGFYVGVFGRAIVLATRGKILAFRNAAEPTLFLSAGVRPLEIALWLQLRRLGAGGGRWIGSVITIAAIFAPPAAGVVGNARTIVMALLAVALQMSVELPTLLLARTPLRRPLVVLGSMLACGGFAFGALSLFEPGIVRTAVAFVRVDPGAAFTRLLQGNPVAVASAIGLLVGLGAIVVLRGDDALPELYVASRDSLVSSGRAGRKPVAEKTAHESARAGHVPAGALTLVWKDWVGFHRGSRLRLLLILWGLSALVGAGAATAARVRHDAAPLVVLGGMTALVLFSVPFGASAGLVGDLAKPLFWLSTAPLRSRLAAWTFARTWRAGVAIGTALLAAGAVTQNVTLALCAIPLACATYWGLQALGVGLFALFPSAIDSRGPMLLVRAIATGAFLLFSLGAAILAGLLGVSSVVATLVGVATFALEGWIVLELAALRFREGSASFAIASNDG